MSTTQAARLDAVRDHLPTLQLLRERLDTAEATGRGVEEARRAYEAVRGRMVGLPTEEASPDPWGVGVDLTAVRARAMEQPVADEGERRFWAGVGR